MKVAIVHDWLVSMGGAEKCLEVFCELFPGAVVYTLVYDSSKVDSDVINGMDIRTSFIQRLPLGKKKHRNYLPIMPSAVKAFNLSGYDIVLSSSHCVAKGAGVRRETCHISYCYTPMRYIWDMYDEYFKGGRSGVAASLLMPLFRNYLRKWDVRTSKNVDYFIAISEYVRHRIKKLYNREADVIYPPVDTDFYINQADRRDDFYLAVSRFVPYKRLELAVEAFNRLELPFVIIGNGPEYRNLKSRAGKNVKILTGQSDASLREYYSRCRALIFPGNEDFGIIPLEAQACGCPVIAYKAGGVLETVVEGVTGKLFYPHTPEALAGAVKSFRAESFDSRVIREHAQKFSRGGFKSRVKEYISEKYKSFCGSEGNGHDIK